MAFIISHKYKFVYIHIPKTGGTSLYRLKEGGGYLNDVLPDTDVIKSHKNILYAKEYLDDYFVWATLRNPFDRFISIYLRGCEVYGNRPFSQFVDEIVFNSLLIQTSFVTQHYWVSIDGGIPVDKFVDFDDLVPQTLSILDNLGVPTDKEFPWLKKSDRKPWQEYYNEEDKYEIEQVYKEDFKLCLNYL